MISILVVEDQAYKSEKISAVIADTLVATEYVVKVVQNGHDAGVALHDGQWDLLVLDLNIPLRLGEEARPDAGAIFLRQVVGRRDYRVPTHVVGMTAFTELADDYGDLFADLTWSIVEFDASSDRWQKRLISKLQHIVASKQVEAATNFDYDVCVVTALEDPELTALMETDGSWEARSVEGDDTIYQFGEFLVGERRIRVVAAAAIQMGMPAATGLAMKMCTRFRPRYLTMCGIAAGVSANFGDILVADKAWDYGSGKSKAKEGADGTPCEEAVFEPSPAQLPLDPELNAKLKYFKTNRPQTVREIETNWQGTRAKTALAVKMGSVASGAAVLENRPLVETIKSHDRKLIGIEMEAYGIFMAARICPAPRPKAFVIKSVCDRADHMKNDVHQGYAAYTSASYLVRFVTEGLFL